MRATRHNGRAGKHGAYNPKHNDRDFDVEHADHIDTVRAEGNVYWDCYQGYCLPGSGQERQFTFSEIEKIANGYHFTISERAKQNLEDSKIEGNSVVAFLNSDGYIGFDKDSAITTKDFFDVYYRWCDENAEVPCKNPASFSKKVKEVAKKYGIEPIQNVLNTEGMKVRGYRGVYIKVRDSENPFLKAS